MALAKGDPIAPGNFDTGSFTMTINSNMISGGSWAKYMGPICIVMIDKIYNGDDAGGGVKIGSLPVGFRPTSIVATGAFSRDYANGVFVQFDTAGDITIFGPKKNMVIHGVAVYFRY